MAADIIMPRVDMTMERGTIRSWNRAAGEAVRAGETLFVIETDKAAMEIEAPADGVLGEILVAPGIEVAVGTVVGRILARGEAPGVADPTAPSPAPASATPAPPPASAVASSSPAPSSPAPSAPAPSAPVAPAAAVTPAAPSRPRATPLARRLARLEGIDLATVAGSGPLGRVGRSDIAALLERRAAAPAAAPMAPPIAAAAPAAARPYVLGVRLELGALDALRARIAPALPGGCPPGLTTMLLRILRSALARHPAVGGAAARDGAIDIALAIAREDGLAMPVLRGLEAMRVPDIARALGRLEATPEVGGAPPRLVLANAGALGLEDFVEAGAGGGVALLSVGRAEGERRIARATLAADRAVLDPAVAARFLADLRVLAAAPELVL